MIHTSKQLKDKVRNISKGDNNVAKALIRTFIMERLLRLSKVKLWNRCGSNSERRISSLEICSDMKCYKR